jgi:transcriptional regulator with XRE-family HTH domain
VSTKKIRATNAQLRAARAFLKLDQATLAAASGVARATISALESSAAESHESTRMTLQTALEARGIVFTNGDKPGFYFDKSKSMTEQ